MLHFTIRLVLWERKEDLTGRSPIAIMLTIDRKQTYFSSPYKIPAAMWDNEKKIVVSKYPNAAGINADLRKRMAEIEQALLKKSMDGGPVSATMIKKELRGEVETGDLNFFKYVNELKKDKEGNQVKASLKNYNKEINRLMEFTGSTYPIISMDATFLRKYEAHERKRGMAQNTINTSFKWLRTVLGHAVKEGIIKENPFDNYTVPRYVQSERIFLEKAERDQWVEYWRSGEVTGTMYETLTYFLLGVFSGLRHSDWGEAHKRVYGDLLRLRPLKTKKKGQWVVLPIGPTLASILEVVKTCKPPISGNKSRVHLKIIAGQLKCTKNITTHTARHSFGTMCAENKIPKSVTAELMGVTVDTVEVYYHLTGVQIAEQAGVLREI